MGLWRRLMILAIILLGVLAVSYDSSSEDMISEVETVIIDSLDDLFQENSETNPIAEPAKEFQKLPIQLQGLMGSIDYEETLDESWQLGESLNVTYSFSDHFIIPESFLISDPESGDTIEVDTHGFGLVGATAYNDAPPGSSDVRIWCDDDTDTTDGIGWIDISFQVQAFTSGIFYSDMYFNAYGTSNETITNSTALTEDFIDADGKMSFSLYFEDGADHSLKIWNVSGNSFYSIFSSTFSGTWTNFQYIDIDELRFVQNSITSQIRSEFCQTEVSNALQRRITISNHEYQSIINVSLPSDAHSIQINPSVSFSFSQGILSLTDTIPTDYRVSFITGSEAQLIPASSVNQQVLYGSDFENGNEDWNVTAMTFSSAQTESGIVFSGNLAYRFEDSDANNDTIANNCSLAPDGNYFFNLDHFNEEFSGTGIIFSYFNETWCDLSLNTSLGVWHQEFYKIEISGNDSGANLRIRFYNASGKIIIDSLDFLTANIIPFTSGFDETTFFTQWRSFDGRNNPIAPERWVDLELLKYPSLELVNSWEYKLTDSHGIAEFCWCSRLYEETYQAISSFWDTTAAPFFNNASVIFLPITVSQGGYSWEFHSNQEEGYQAIPLSRSSPPLTFDSPSSLQDAINPVNNETINLDPANGDYQEILASRGQSYRHYYNLTAETYTYQSDYLVQKPNLLPNTDWVTQSEYPIRFAVRNDAGNTIFCTKDELLTLFATYDNATLNQIGIEGFSGIMAFYTNFEDFVNGNGQILWYQRMANGSLPNFPFYQIYDHVFVNLSGSLYDSFFIPTSNIRNRIVVENGSDYLSVSFSFQQVFLGRTFQLRKGFKYNTTTHRFSNINHFSCLDQSFDDLGVSYEIDATDFSRNSAYRPEKFTLYNINESDMLNPTISVDISTVWDARAYFADFYSAIEIVSQNSEAWKFDFKDMEQAGFVEKYLNLHDQLMPDNSVRRVLRAGMYGRPYVQGEIVEVDPIFSAKQTTDSRDWFIWYDHDDTLYTGRDASTALEVGPSGSAQIVSRSGITWDTGITTTIASLSDGEFSFYIYTEYMEATDYAGFGLYDKTSDADEYWSEAEMMAAVSTAYAQSMYYSNPSFFSDLGTGNKTFSGTNTDNLLASWLSHHNGAPSSRQYLPLKLFEGTGMGGPGTQDVWRARESSYATASYRPSLTFTYTTNTAPNAPTLNQAHGDTYAGKSFSFKTDHTDDDGAADIDSMHIWFDTSEYDFSMHCHESSAGGSVTVDSGASYLIGTPTYSHTGITNGKRVTWTITIDWDYTWNYFIATKAKTIDDASEDSGWTTLASGNYFIPRLEIEYTWTPAINSAYDEDHDGVIEDNEWFRGGFAVTASGGTGSVIYYDSAVNFDSSYAATVEVQLFYDTVDLGDSYRDLTIVDGAFSIPSYTPTSAAGLDTTAWFQAKLQGIPSGGADSTSSSARDVTSHRDNQGSSGASLTHSDSDSDSDGFNPENGYDDDLLLEYSLSGASDGSGVGLATNPYCYRWNGGSFGAWNTSTSISPSSSHGLTADADVKIRDEVSNEVIFDGEDVTTDTSNPDQVATLQCRLDSYSDSGEFDDDTTIYFTFGTVSDTGSGVSSYYAEIGDTSPDEDAGTDGQDTDLGTEGLMTYYIWAVDYAGNVGSVNSDTITIDLTDPVISAAIFTNDQVAPNWFDQGSLATATIQITWTETNPSQVWIMVSGIDTYTDNSPSGGTSIFNIAITSEPDGSYNIEFHITDLAARSWSDTTGSFGDAPLKLDDSGPTSYTVAMAAGVFYESITNDMTPDIIESGASDGSGVGLHAIPYYFGWRLNDGSWTYPGWQVSATWTGSFSTDSINYDFVVQVRDALGNVGVWVYDSDNIIDDNAPTDLSIYQILESSSYLYISGSTVYYQNTGVGSHNFSIYITASDSIAGLEKAVFPNTVSVGGTDTTEAGSSFEYNWTYTVAPLETFSGSANVTVYDQAGNTANVSFALIPSATKPGSDYYSLMVFPDSTMSFAVNLSGIDWRLYRDASIYYLWNGSQAFEMAVYWRNSNLSNWETIQPSSYWGRVTFDLTGSYGSENYRGEDGTFGFRFKNTAGTFSDTIRIKWTRLEFKTFEAASSDWAFQQPGDLDGWQNGSNSLCDVKNSLMRVNATVTTDLLIYFNETIDASEYDLLSINCRASENTILQLWNGSNHVLAAWQVTQSYASYIIQLNVNWTGTQNDLILVFPNASAYAWFEVNWLILEEDTQISVVVSDRYLRFYSANNTLCTRIRIDGELIGDYFDLESVPLNLQKGKHYVEAIAFLDWQEIAGFPIYLHARAYYFEYWVGLITPKFTVVDASLKAGVFLQTVLNIDYLDEAWYNFNGNNYTYSASIDTTGWSEGYHNLTFYANTTTADFWSENVTVLIDNTNPDLFSVTPANGSDVSHNLLRPWQVNATDNYSLAFVSYKWDNASIWRNSTVLEFDFDTSVLAWGWHNFTLRVVDSADNYNETFLKYRIGDFTPVQFRVIDADLNEIADLSNFQFIVESQREEQVFLGNHTVCVYLFSHLIYNKTHTFYLNQQIELELPIKRTTFRVVEKNVKVAGASIHVEELNTTFVCDAAGEYQTYMIVGERLTFVISGNGKQKVFRRTVASEKAILIFDLYKDVGGVQALIQFLAEPEQWPLFAAFLTLASISMLIFFGIRLWKRREKELGYE